MGQNFLHKMLFKQKQNRFKNRNLLRFKN